MPSLFTDFDILFLIATATSLFGTMAVIALAPRIGLVDRPGQHKSHDRPTPLGGGIAIYIAFLVILLFPSFRNLLTVVIVLAAGVLMVLGFIDDLLGVSALVKFSALVGLTVVLTRFGIMAQTTRIYVVDLLITVLWVAGVSSAFNAIDNMDGLATGITCISSVTFFVVACQTDQHAFGGLSLCLAGASFGFLVMNFPPARVFMGDAGSLPLGFILAALGITGDWSENPIIAATIPILILGFPIFDLSFTVLCRHFRGITRTIIDAIKHCDTDHTSHRLRKLGLGPVRALLFMWFISVSFAISAITLRHAFSVDAVLHLLQALCITLSLIFILLLISSPSRARGTSSSGPARTCHEGSAFKIRLILLSLWGIGFVVLVALSRTGAG